MNVLHLLFLVFVAVSTAPAQSDELTKGLYTSLLKVGYTWIDTSLPVRASVAEEYSALNASMHGLDIDSCKQNKLACLKTKKIANKMFAKMMEQDSRLSKFLINSNTHWAFGSDALDKTMERISKYATILAKTKQYEAERLTLRVRMDV